MPNILDVIDGALADYDYEFSVWPAPTGWEKPVYGIFQNCPRMVMTFTEPGYAEFRASAERSGLTLREVTRIPHHEPEPVP